MLSYGYDRENAEKVYEIGRVRAAEQVVGASVGAFAVWKYRPVAKEYTRSYAIFRKSWMKYPVPVAVFAAAYYIATMVP